MENYRKVKKALPGKEVLRLINNASWKVIPKSSQRLSDDVLPHIVTVRVQPVFYVEIDGDLRKDGAKYQQTLDQLRWLTESELLENPSTNGIGRHPAGENGYKNGEESEFQVEIGPRLNFKTPFCANALSITSALSLHSVTRIEKSLLCTIRYRAADSIGSDQLKRACVDQFMDPILQCEYKSPIISFHVDLPKEQTFVVAVCKDGRAALAAANKQLSLGFDDDDLDYYTNLFQSQLKRDPTNLECMDLAQSNSEHSRHWFFNGKMVIDGKTMPETLFQMVKGTNSSHYTNPNNIIKFHDNSSAIQGYDGLPLFRPKDPLHPSAFQKAPGTRHIIFTAETHNFPTAVEPFSGATTGTGGRIRDVQAAGRGAHVIAGTVGYSFGSCYVPGFDAPWEEKGATYPSNFASPLKVIIEASNGASDYGNKFGEPVITGFARSFGATLADGSRCEWIKPIMFSGGIGSIDHQWTAKQKQLPNGMKVVKIGGPVYNIGLGGGAASSTSVQGSNDSVVDLNAVQRGDAEMEQKLNRVIRACIELEDNPIVSIHDQGAGGNANVLKEIVDPAGALIKADQFTLGDETVSIVALWNAEYQESVAVLVPANKIDILTSIAHRERCAVDVVGEITGTGKIVLEDFSKDQSADGPMHTPVDLPLELVLGDIPRKTYHLKRHAPYIPRDGLEQDFRHSVTTSFDMATLKQSLYRVLRLPSVGSKRYLTNKVDRSVTGLVAQQQCVGPLHTPMADVAVIALSHFDTKGSATAIGEQPIKMLFDVKRGARMTVVESLTNLMFAKISDLKDVKCSANWMWPAKLPGQGAALYDACGAMCDIMRELGIAVDGGKDSLSMAAKCGEEIVKSPGTLVVSTYVQCPDVRKVITPSLKVPGGNGSLLWIDPGRGHRRLGGSAYCQASCQLDIPFEVPDVDSVETFVRAFQLTQRFLDEGKLAAGHDISDGGLIVCLLEMAIAGNCVFDVNIETPGEYAPEYLLFAEEVGWVLEVPEEHCDAISESFSEAGVPCFFIGRSMQISVECRSVDDTSLYAPFISIDNHLVFGADETGIAGIRSVWEDFSYHIEKLQTNGGCAESEKVMLAAGADPTYTVSFTPDFDVYDISTFDQSREFAPKVAVIREEGSNGDREMAAALHMVGFEVWDVNVQDLLDEKIDLGQFRGLVFVGGFSYADVFGSAKGWAAVLAFSPSARKQLEHFYKREDTFSLGVCNGCQLLTKLGLVGHASVQSDRDNHIDVNDTPVQLKHNTSGRFESRFSTVKIAKSNAIMLRGMEGTQVGVWVAHGEGRFSFRDGTSGLRSASCVALQFVDSQGEATEEYPPNPNGSAEGIAGICTPNGRHLVMMPHPERSVLSWQWPWCPENLNWPKNAAFTPWIKMFRNAYEWSQA